MKKLIFILLLTLNFSFSCKRNDASIQFATPDGSAGVSIDSQGNLVINAQVYIFNRNDENPEIRPADDTDDFKVEIINKLHWSRKNIITKIASGTISDGRLSVVIPVFDENNLENFDFLFIPEFIELGNNNKIGYIEFNVSDASLYLYANPQIEQFDVGTAYVYRRIKGDEYYFTYSEGEAVISGSYENNSGDLVDYEYIDIKLTEGWNSICYSYDYDESVNISSITDKSKKVPSDAIWVLVLE